MLTDFCKTKYFIWNNKKKFDGYHTNRTDQIGFQKPWFYYEEIISLYLYYFLLSGPLAELRLQQFAAGIKIETVWTCKEIQNLETKEDKESVKQI